MRSVVVLALLWQTAVVLGLGAIHAPDNNNRASSTLPWVGKEAWSTSIKEFVPSQLLESRGYNGDLFIHGQDVSVPNSCNTRLVALNDNIGNEQWADGPVGECEPSSFAHQLPYVAAASQKGGATIYSVNSTTPSSVSPIMPFPRQSDSSAIFSVGSFFFWFTSNPVDKTVMTKIGPFARTSTVSNTNAPQSNRFYAGLNYLFTVDQATSTLLTCFSAATGDVAWTTVVAGVADVKPSPFNDIVLALFKNGSSTLFNATNGKWIWTVALDQIPHPEAANVFFPSVVLMLGTVPGSEMNTLTGVELSSGKVLWKIFAGSAYSEMNANCALESNIFASLIQDNPTSGFVFYGIDAHTGQRVFEFTPTIQGASNTTATPFKNPHVSCFHNDVFFTVTEGSLKYSNVQRVSFTHQP